MEGFFVTFRQQASRLAVALRDLLRALMASRPLPRQPTAI